MKIGRRKRKAIVMFGYDREEEMVYLVIADAKNQTILAHADLNHAEFISLHQELQRMVEIFPALDPHGNEGRSPI